MMLKKDLQQDALKFFESHKENFRSQHREDILVLETVHDVSRVSDPEVAKYLKNKFFIKMSRQAFTLLKF